MTVQTTMGMMFAPLAVPRAVQVMLPGFEEANDGPWVSIEHLTDEAVDALVATWLNNFYANVERANPWMRGN